MATEVRVTSVFEEWYSVLDESKQQSITRVVSMLKEAGPVLPFPYSSAIAKSKIAMRELRVKSKGDQIRVLYVFDPVRSAVLLLGGSKIGKGNRWYERAIPQAERLYAQYLVDFRGE